MDKPMTKSEYKGDKCPNCRSENITGERINPVLAVDECSRSSACNDCGAVWTEEFKLTGYCSLFIGDDEEPIQPDKFEN